MPAAPVERILAYCSAQPELDVLRTVEAFPSLLQQKSLLLDLVLEEFKVRRERSPDLPVQHFHARFRGFESSIRQSIFRLLEVQKYLEGHPDLLRLVESFDWPEPGEILQGFTVLEELGRGALARVYLCQETEVGERLVVVKMARGGDYEAALLGRLDHGHIVPIYSVFNDAQRHVSYICMPFRGRSTLQDLVDHAFEHVIPVRADAILQAARIWKRSSDVGLPTDVATAARFLSRGSYVDGVVRLGVQISDALAHAHGRGVIHGDLKPSNVLLTPHGQPLLIDFNLAKDKRAEIGPRGGTLPYMAPEQLRSIAVDSQEPLPGYDARSEVYSFGVLLYQLLTGVVPYQVDENGGGPADVANQLLERQRSPLVGVRARNRLVNGRLEALVLQCLAWCPAARPQSMDELSRRLRGQARPVARIHRTTLARPTTTNLLAIAVAAMCAIGAAYVSLRPPYHVRQFHRGIALQQQQAYKPALACFDRAIEHHPGYRDALFERARTYMRLENFNDAIDGFASLSKKWRDGASAAYAGYCFNMKKHHGAAIASYELALEQGFESSGFHNNLGVSYRLSRSRYSLQESMVKAQHHLERALALDPDSTIIRFNLVEVAIQRSSVRPNYIPESAVEHIEFLLENNRHDPATWMVAMVLYRVMSQHDGKYVNRQVEAVKMALHHGGGPSKHELMSEPGYSAVRSHPAFSELFDLADTSSHAFESKPPHRFIEPVALDSVPPLN